MGTSSFVYVSIPDTTSTCANLGLPSLPQGYSYRCVTSSTLQKTDGTGWIPVNLSSLSTGSPLPKLPIDPINTTSTGQYYTYVAGGSWELNTILESQKYRANKDFTKQNFPGVLAFGTNLNLSPVFSTNGLVSYWTFDEASGTTAYDRSGNGNDGALTNGPTWTSGKVGGALSFDGVNDYVDIPSNSVLNPTTAITVSAWIKSAVSSEYPGAWQVVSNYSSYILGTSQGGSKAMCFIVHTNTWNYSYCYTVSDPENWHHFVGTYDKTISEEKLYVDGVLRSTTTASGNLNNGGGLHIGHRECCGEYFNGRVDDVRIYNRALSESEIQAIYNATK
jgi:hypothetical protein